MEVDTTKVEKEKKKAVSASYSRISEAVRHATAGPFQCQMFCGGKLCKYERSDVWAQDEMAIPGLFSHWVTDKMLAMARPNCSGMKLHCMVDSFKREGIRTVFNLQEWGEHASCGPPLHSSGFSYDPIELMDNDIYYYNYNIVDYSVPLLRTLLDICKVLVFAQSEGAVAIHCHAGLGRTGVVIACFLVYHHKMKPTDAILLVRKNRPRSIQTRNQLKIVFKFANFLSPLWIQLHNPILERCEPRTTTLYDIINSQRVILHGQEAKTLKHTPKLLHVVCSWVMKKLGLPSSLLYKKIRSKCASTRPFTCPASYMSGDEGDLDSLSASDADIEKFVARQRTKSADDIHRSDRSSFSRIHRQYRSMDGIPVSHRLSLSPRSSLRPPSPSTTEKEDPIPGEEEEEEPVQSGPGAAGGTEAPKPATSSDDSHDECTESKQCKFSNEDRGQLVSLVESVLKKQSGPPDSQITQEGKCELGKKGSSLDEVITQINVGIWESVETLEGADLGRLMIMWFSTLSSPVLSLSDLHSIARKAELMRPRNKEVTDRQLDRVGHAVETLPSEIQGTLHCLLATVKALQDGPLKLDRCKATCFLQTLLSPQHDDAETDPETVRMFDLLLTWIKLQLPLQGRT